MRATLFVLTALLLACAPARGASGFATASGALAAQAGVQFRINIPTVLRMGLRDHPRELLVSADDARRGFVVVTGPGIEIAANHRQGSQLNARLVESLVEEVEIGGLAAPVRFQPGVASVNLPRTVRTEMRPVEYRMKLAHAVAAGSYPWPVSLSLGQP